MYNRLRRTKISLLLTTKTVQKRKCVNIRYIDRKKKFVKNQRRTFHHRLLPKLILITNKIKRCVIFQIDVLPQQWTD